MGSAANAQDEWIEIVNTGDHVMDLNGWGIYEEGGAVLVEPLSGIMEPRSVFVIERTDDQTISNRAADIPPSGWSGYGLSNNGEYLVLKNAEGIMSDAVPASGGWFAGSRNEFRTMERVAFLTGSDASEWNTYSGAASLLIDAGGNPIMGTPGTSPLIYFNPETPAPSPYTPPSQPLPSPIILPSPSIPSPDITPYPSFPPKPRTERAPSPATPPTPSPFSASPSPIFPLPDTLPKIIFSELMPNPQGSDQEEEWLELQNLSSEPVKLGGWECKTQSGHRYLFPEYTSIAARGYLMLPRSETHLPLRNEGDTLMLTASSRATADTVTYGPAIEGQSYSRMNSGEWNWTARVTPGTPNMFSAGDSAPSASPRSLVLQDSLSLDDRSPSETPSSNAQTYSPIPVLPASAVSKARGIPFWMPIAILAAVFAYAGIWIRRKISGSHPKNI